MMNALLIGYHMLIIHFVYRCMKDIFCQFYRYSIEPLTINAHEKVY